MAYQHLVTYEGRYGSGSQLQGIGQVLYCICQVLPLSPLDAGLQGLQIHAGGAGTLLPVVFVRHLQGFAAAAGIGGIGGIALGLVCRQAGTARQFLREPVQVARRS